MTIYSRLDTAVLLNRTDSSIVDAELDVIDHTWTKSEASAPWLTATITIPPPSIALWALLDPAVRPIVLLSSNVSASDGTSDWDKADLHGLRVYTRTRNDDASVTMTLVSAEQDLIDFTPQGVIQTNWIRQNDVSAIIANVITTVYSTSAYWAQSVAPTPEQQLSGAFPTYRAVTNLCTNSGFEYGTTGWVGQNATITRDTTQRHSGLYSMKIAPSTTSDASRAELTQNLQASTTYTLSAWFRQSGVMTGTGATNGRYIYLAGSIAGAVSVLAQTSAAPNVANAWNKVALTFTTPALLDAGSFSLRVRNGTSTANPVNLWVDDITLVEGDGLETTGDQIVYFDGDTPDGTLGYNYDWQGDPGNSSSTRTPVLARDEDALTWSPGQSAWDFLQPILESLGGRLYSITGYDSFPGSPAIASFRWITNRYTPAGIAARFVYGSTLYALEQTFDLGATFDDGTPMYADGVVLAYRWTDNLGVEQVAFDSFSMPQLGGYKNPYFQELAEPYPGPGRAQGLALRLNARRTMLTVTGPYDPGLTPSAQVSVTDPRLGGSVLGVIDSVDHNPLQGTSTVRTKQAISYPSNAWVTKTKTWAATTGTWATQ